MNTLTEDFNEFISRRLDCVEANSEISHNEAAHALEQILNHEQKHLLMNAIDYVSNHSAILEENAYRQGLIDAIQIMDSLKNMCL